MGDRLDPIAMLDGVGERLRRDARLSADVVTRPHPLLVAVTREDNVVLFTAGSIWDKGREVFRPFV